MTRCWCALLASGICHSDLSYIDGTWPIPLPIVLGHEGCAVIEDVGEGVDPGRIGDRVVLTFSPRAAPVAASAWRGGRTYALTAAAGLDGGHLGDGTTRLRLGGAPVHHLAFVSSFAHHAVVPLAGTVPITDELDPTLACLLGCGVTTGVMSVTRRANVRPAEAVLVLGCGGIGLAAVMGAELVSADPIVAVDPLGAKRELALEVGATHALDPSAGDIREQVREIVPGGVDHSFVAVGVQGVAEQAFACTRAGGTTVLIGQPSMSTAMRLPIYDATQFEHTVLGSNLGAAVPALHVPGLARLAASGALGLERLVTHRFDLEQIEQAVATTASGQAGRVVIDLRSQG